MPRLLVQTQLKVNSTNAIVVTPNHELKLPRQIALE
jgi:hypothetical protein